MSFFNVNGGLKRVLVKICGITDAATALTAADAGADALGFVFAPSRRRIRPEAAREIISQLPPALGRVGVFVNEDPRVVLEIAALCGLTAVQLSGDEPPSYRLDSGLPVIRTVRVGGNRPLPNFSLYQAEAFLFDTYREGSYGGSGEAFDLKLLKGMNCPKPVILAGGLNCGNVKEAVRLARPYAVDVSSGVETGGIKDIQKIKDFIALAKEA